ncbi:MAG: SIS domain-containing protein [Terracidiphilus sp.]
MESAITDLVRSELAHSAAVLHALGQDGAVHATLAAAALATADALKAGRKLLIAGNGGSAADAQHLAAEFVSRLCQDRPAMRALALTTDTSALTAIGNDYGFEHVFGRQLAAVAQPGDVFMAISASGNSPNILCALELSRQMSLVTIGLTGKSGSKMAPLCDHCLRVPSDVTMHIQEAHLALEHIFCMIAEQAYFGAERFAAPSGM